MILLETSLNFDLSQIISAVGVIICGWFSYNQYAKNKKTDKKLEQAKQTITEKERKRSNAYAKIYGKMWKQLYSLDCDRLSILQPHPLNRKQFLSIGMEVRGDGIVTLKEAFCKIPMEDIPQFTGELEERDFIFYKRIKTDAKDKLAIAKFSGCGCKSIAIQRLCDEEGEWIGSILCEWCRDTKMYSDYVKGQLVETAADIQYILPEYDETLKND